MAREQIGTGTHNGAGRRRQILCHYSNGYTFHKQPFLWIQFALCGIHRRIRIFYPVQTTEVCETLGSGRIILWLGELLSYGKGTRPHGSIMGLEERDSVQPP